MKTKEFKREYLREPLYRDMVNLYYASEINDITNPHYSDSLGNIIPNAGYITKAEKFFNNLWYEIKSKYRNEPITLAVLFDIKKELQIFNHEQLLRLHTIVNRSDYFSEPRKASVNGTE